MDVNTLLDLAAIVRGRRRELGWSQADVAERAHVSRQWVSEFENRKATAEIRLVLRLLDALDLRLTIAERVAAPASNGAIDLDALLDEHRGP